MSVDKDKTRINVTLQTDLKIKLDEAAKKEERSTSNLVAKLIKEYIEQNQSRE